jgi:hypothetical protein
MTKWFAVALTVIAAALIPGGAIAGGESGGGYGSSSDIDIVRVEMQGSLSTNADINVFGTLECTSGGPLIFSATLAQDSTGGTAAGTNTGHTCRAGKTIKWVITAQGDEVMVDDEIRVTVVAVPDLGPTATETEEKVLHWGLHVGF